MDDVLGAAAPDEERLVRTYDKLCGAMKNMKHDAAARKKLQEPEFVARLANRIALDTRAYPTAEHRYTKPRALLKALKTLGYLLHSKGLAALLDAAAEERLTARLCDILRTCTSHSTLHVAVWCVSVEALHRRESCWAYFQALCAMLAGTGDTATATGTGTTGTAPSTPGGGAASARSSTSSAASTSSASVGAAAAAAASGVEALDYDALKALAVLVPIVREDIAASATVTAAVWAPPVYTRLVAASARERDGAAQVANALLVHVVPLPEPLVACFVRDLDERRLLDQLCAGLMGAGSDDDALCAAADAWGTMVGLCGQAVFHDSAAQRLVAASDRLFASKSEAVREAAYASWSFVAQAAVREAARSGAAEPLQAAMRPLSALVQSGERSTGVLASALKCWVSFVLKLDRATVVEAFGLVVAGMAQRLAAMGSAVPSFVFQQLCALFEALLGDDKLAPMLTLAWLAKHGPALCAPYHVLLLLAQEHAAQSAPPSVLPFLRALATRLARADKAAGDKSKSAASCAAEALRPLASLAICNAQQLFEAVKSGACAPKDGLDMLEQTAALVQLLDDGPRVSAATCKLTVGSPSAQMQYTLADHILCLLLALVINNDTAQLFASSGSGSNGNRLVGVVLELFERCAEQDLVHSGHGAALEIVVRALQTAEDRSKRLAERCELWCSCARVLRALVERHGSLVEHILDNADSAEALTSFLVVPFAAFAGYEADTEQQQQQQQWHADAFVGAWKELAAPFCSSPMAAGFVEHLVDATSRCLDRLHRAAADTVYLGVLPMLLEALPWHFGDAQQQTQQTQEDASEDFGSFDTSTAQKNNMRALRALYSLMARADAADEHRSAATLATARCVALVFRAVLPESVPYMLAKLGKQLVRWLAATGASQPLARAAEAWAPAACAAFGGFADCVGRSDEDALLSNLSMCTPLFRAALESTSRELRAAMVALWNRTYGARTEPFDCPEALCDLVISVAEKDRLEVKMRFLEDDFAAQQQQEQHQQQQQQQEQEKRLSSAASSRNSTPQQRAKATKRARVAFCDPDVDVGPGMVLRGGESLDPETLPPPSDDSGDQDDSTHASASPPRKRQHAAAEAAEEEHLVVKVEDDEEEEEARAASTTATATTADELTAAMGELADKLDANAARWNPEDLMHISRCCERMNSSIVRALSTRLSSRRP